MSSEEHLHTFSNVSNSTESQRKPELEEFEPTFIPYISAFLCERSQASLAMFLLDESTDSSQQLREDIKIIDKLTAVGGTAYCRKLCCEDQIEFLEGLFSSFIFFPFFSIQDQEQ